jgi:hypothetical protein
MTNPAIDRAMQLPILVLSANQDWFRLSFLTIGEARLAEVKDQFRGDQWNICSQQIDVTLQVWAGYLKTGKFL